MSHAHLGKPAELPSTEKLERHQVVGGPNGTGQCKKCQLSYPSALCPTMEVLISRPCMGYSTSGKVQILYSKNWPQELQILAKNLDIENWQPWHTLGESFALGPMPVFRNLQNPMSFRYCWNQSLMNSSWKNLKNFNYKRSYLENSCSLLNWKKP